MAQSPGPRTFPVLVIGGAKPAVLVTPELVAKMDELEKRSGTGRHFARREVHGPGQGHPGNKSRPPTKFTASRTRPTY